MKRCRQCKSLFEARKALMVVCSADCAILWSKTTNGIAHIEKATRASMKLRKDALKTNSDWLREAQTSFNKYIRARDVGQDCISCDKPDNGKHQRHASHFIAVGESSKLRFNTYNVHTSCATCNDRHSGNLLKYRISLIKQIGVDKVEWLELGHEPVKYSTSYLQRVKKIFNKKARRVAK
jgi:hypothetical protein